MFGELFIMDLVIKLSSSYINISLFYIEEETLKNDN